MATDLLPRNTPEIIWQWGVCETYRDAVFLSQIVKGTPSLDAYDVLGLEIRAVDRVWVLLRDAFLPAPVLTRVWERIKSKVDVFDTPHRARALSAVSQREQQHDYWGAAARMASAAVKHHDSSRTNVEAAYDQEYRRQLQIIREELDSWVLEQEETERE